MTNSGIIPASHARAILVRKGETIEVINTHGNQVLDTWAFNAEDINENMSMEHTRSVNSRIYASAGDVLSTNRRRPILRFRSDSSPGRHDTLLCACNQAVYTELGVNSYHRNCQDNLYEALRAFDAHPPSAPSPLNLFMNVTVGPDGDVIRKPPVSRPGDRVEFVAEMDAIVVFSSCPQDITPVNGEALTPSDAHYRVR